MYEKVRTRQDCGDGKASDRNTAGSEGNGRSDEDCAERFDGAFCEVDGEAVGTCIV